MYMSTGWRNSLDWSFPHETLLKGFRASLGCPPRGPTGIVAAERSWIAPPPTRAWRGRTAGLRARCALRRLVSPGFAPDVTNADEVQEQVEAKPMSRIAVRENRAALILPLLRDRELL